MSREYRHEFIRMQVIWPVLLNILFIRTSFTLKLSMSLESTVVETQKPEGKSLTKSIVTLLQNSLSDTLALAVANTPVFVPYEYARGREWSEIVLSRAEMIAFVYPIIGPTFAAARGLYYRLIGSATKTQQKVAGMLAMVTVAIPSYTAALYFSGDDTPQQIAATVALSAPIAIYISPMNANVQDNFREFFGLKPKLKERKPLSELYPTIGLAQFYMHYYGVYSLLEKGKQLWSRKKSEQVIAHPATTSQ